MKRYSWLLITLLPALVFAAPGDKITVGGMSLPLSADSVTDGVTNKAFTAAEKAKLSTLDATQLRDRSTHTGTQPATTIATDDSHQFATTAEKSAWNAKAPLAAPTFTDSVTAPTFNSSAADGHHYVRPYNSTAFAGTPLVGMLVTTPTGPQWYTGSAWEAIGSGGASAIADLTDWPSGLTAAELGYLDGATSNIQAQINAISVGAPVTTAPTYSDQTCTKGQYAFDSSYAYFCRAVNTWGRIAMGEWNNPTPDTTPAAFSFADETDIALSTAKTSNAITVAGINASTAISVTGDTGYGYSKNSAACTATSGTVVAGDTVAACVTSSGSNSTATTATVTIGGVSDEYSVTTAAGASYNDILYYWNMENTLVADKGGVTGTNSNDTFTTTAKVGTYAIARSTNYGYVAFDITSSQFDPAAGQIGFWYQSTGYQSGSGNYIAIMRYDSTNYLLFAQHASGGIKAEWSVGGATAVTEYTTTGLTANTWYYITYKYHPGDSGNDAVLTIYNADGSVFGASSTATLSAMTQQPILMRFGNVTGDASRPIVDHFVVSNDITRDMWAINSTTGM